MPATPWAPSRTAPRKSTSISCDVQSRGSWPQIACSAHAASSTLRANGPTWSSELPNATTP